MRGGACLQGFETVEAARGGEMMSARPMRTALPATSLRVGGEILAGTKSQLYPLESEPIQRVLRGQHEVFREIVRPCGRAVFMPTQAILNNEADPEDVAHQAILKAFTNLAKFRGDSKFSTWPVRIAANEALMKLSKERRQKLHDSLDDGRKDGKGNYVPRDFADWREISSEALRTKELQQALSWALASLMPRRREVLVLRDLQHFIIEETAKLLGIGKSAMKTRLLRARRQMSDALAPGMDGSWTPAGGNTNR